MRKKIYLETFEKCPGPVFPATDVSFIKFLTLHNRCLHSKRCQVLIVFVLTYLLTTVC